ncbi:ATP-dependent RNA helicase [Blastomyces dermatitidis ER-3]|uniref:RNA helicase n=2 Tax=Blastomyces TaxID=229219 RepID=A0A179URC4_BLAGS|nr:ATP-dependent RNA helicase [Blastomyces gilchristii SLH14081]XP_045274946.1 ATP-dependent RNA helicase [Blastomyces dermatitidis ER-3]EEQ87660.2 ATP-dependent RNA helicase [Blastomyces dermatitidis ER-3]OAT09758.1 ATP-dependent RNA helicase [Blastomyces gilchristii SLH14081]
MSKKRKRNEDAEQGGQQHPGPKRVVLCDKDSPGTTTSSAGKGQRTQDIVASKNSNKSIAPANYGQNVNRSTRDKERSGPAAPTSLRERAKALYHTRKQLPIFPHADEIRKHLQRNDVTLLVGETGSGKSTQVPQFLVDEKWAWPRTVKVHSTALKKKANSQTKSADGDNGPAQKETVVKEITVGGCIAITQPRRVAAVSLARRVADEMGTPLGNSSPASKVGYSVRFDSSTSPNTRVKFLTEGMLLQEMLTDPWLTKYSAVVVDEVHERGVNVDLILGFLRNMVSGKKEGRGGLPLKVVVMSATADMESLLGFFGEGLNSGISDKDGSSGMDKGKPNNDQASDEVSSPSSQKVSVCHIKGRQYPVKVIYSPEPVHDFVDAALQTIFRIHMKEPLPGDILVFLTGQETVESLEALVNEYAVGMDPALPKVQVLPLFAALPQAAQQRVFTPAPPRTRKIILSTNIAETSVTVSGVRYVVDCGKAKMKQFRARLGLDSLLVKPISKSAAIQRKGRAGREAPGQCYRLYTEKDYLALQEANTPEILRCDLSQAILNMKARGVDDIVSFPFLTRPSREALEKALLQLFSIQALDEMGKISEIGEKIAKLPLNAQLGRVLLASAEYGPNCLRNVIDIISCLSVENIFLNTTSEEKKEEAEKARRDLYRREGDHLTMLATVRAYASENSDRKAWASRHLVSHRAMQAVMDVRKQLVTQCRQAKLLPNDKDTNGANGNHAISSEENPVSILKSFLTGFASNTARLFPDGSYKTIVGNQTVAIHPSSVLFGRKVEAIMYNEYVFTNRSYARGVSAVQMDWVGEALGEG